MDEKKQLIAVSSLGAVFLIVVGFMIFKPSDAPVPDATVDQTEQVRVQADAPPPAIKNPTVAANLPERDPFIIPVKPVEKEGEKPPTPPKGFKPGNVRPTGIRDIGMPNPLEGNPNGEAPPIPTAPAIPPFSYVVTGVVIGRKPAAVFQDSTGNQKLIPEGSIVDPDTKLMSINIKFVTVSYHGKMIKVKVGDMQTPSGEMIAK